MRTFALLATLVLVPTIYLTAGDAMPIQTAPSTDQKPVDAESLRKKMSYFVGINVKEAIDRAVAEGGLDRDELMRGLAESSAGKAVVPSEADRQQVFQQYESARQATLTKASAAALAENVTFLAAHAKMPGVMSTASGLQYEVLSAGKKDGKQPKATSKVRVNYVGSKRDGTVFDASEKHGGPAEFALNQVIPGWTEGVQLMREGDKYRFTVPSDLAYGHQGPGEIGADQVLMFDVELIAVLSDPK